MDMPNVQSHKQVCVTHKVLITRQRFAHNCAAHLGYSPRRITASPCTHVHMATPNAVQKHETMEMPNVRHTNKQSHTKCSSNANTQRAPVGW